ncbi:MAG: hypothetical protein WKF61_09355 [Luteimonas sp.]
MKTEFDRLQELEWQAQERALREERERSGVPPTDSRIAEYRLIARALRQPLPDLLPADFARDLAARVGHVPLDTRLERWLMRLLVGAMVMSGLATALIYGAGWWQAVVDSVPQTSATTVNWIFAIAACMGGSWLFECMRQVAAHDAVARA